MNSHIGLPPFLFDSPDKKIIAWRFYYILVSPQKWARWFFVPTKVYSLSPTPWDFKVPSFLLAETPSKFGGYPRVIKNEVKIWPLEISEGRPDPDWFLSAIKNIPSWMNNLAWFFISVVILPLKIVDRKWYNLNKE